MNFEFTKDHKMIQPSAKEFAQEVIAPTSIDRDIKAEFPAEIIKQMGELGFLGMMVSHDYWGAGLDTISYVLAMIEISKVDASCGVIMSVNNSLVCYGLEKYGSDFLKQKTLLKAAFDFSIGGSGIIRGKKILELLKQVYQDRNFEDLPKGIKLRICANNFNNG